MIHTRPEVLYFCLLGKCQLFVLFVKQNFANIHSNRLKTFPTLFIPFILIPMFKNNGETKSATPDASEPPFTTLLFIINWNKGSLPSI